MPAQVPCSELLETLIDHRVVDLIPNELFSGAQLFASTNVC